MKIEGIVRYTDLESGAWVIESTVGLIYHPTNMPEQLKHNGAKVIVSAHRSDAMSFVMMGELIDITQFKTISI